MALVGMKSGLDKFAANGSSVNILRNVDDLRRAEDKFGDVDGVWGKAERYDSALFKDGSVIGS